MELIGVLNAVENSITKEGGILTEINNLMEAKNEAETRKEVFKLIGTVISLVIDIIKAAVEPADSKTSGQTKQ
jgi:hypothetical protein